ncbi:hypothetical protein CRG98_042604, partial [Punica granatum]
MNLRFRKVSSHGLANLARLQEARARWLGELAVRESKVERTWQGCNRQERGGSANLRCRKVRSHGLADPARLQEARARWLGELALQESKLERVSRPRKVARGTSEVARRTCGAGKKRHERGGSANLRCRKEEARARWLGELAVQESKLARVSRPGKVARSTGEVARRTYDAGKKVSSHGLADRQDCKRHEGGGSANLRRRKVSSHGLADRQDCKRHEGGGSANLRRRKVSSHGLADRQDCKRHEGGGSANLRRRKVSSHGLANLARLQEARASWLGELSVQESKVER